MRNGLKAIGLGVVLATGLGTGLYAAPPAQKAIIGGELEIEGFGISPIQSVSFGLSPCPECPTGAGVKLDPVRVVKLTDPTSALLMTKAASGETFPTIFVRFDLVGGGSWEYELTNNFIDKYEQDGLTDTIEFSAAMNGSVHWRTIP